MIFLENCLLADNSHEISNPIFSKIRMSKNLSSTAVVIGALRVKRFSRRHKQKTFSHDVKSDFVSFLGNTRWSF